MSGGTWRANRYPGCRVDIANQYYAYSFEPTDHWSHYYSEQPEILQYLEDVDGQATTSPPTYRFSTEVDRRGVGRGLGDLARSCDPRGDGAKRS